MKRKELQAGWEGLSEEIMAGMAERRSQHPKACIVYPHRHPGQFTYIVPRA